MTPSGTGSTTPSSSGSATPSTTDPDVLAELEEERGFLLASLDDLEREREAGDIDDADYVTLRDDYTRRAAATLRAIEAGRAQLPAPPRASWGRRLAIVAAVLVLAGMAGVGVALAAGLRLPGESATGDIRTSTVELLAEARVYLGLGEPVEALRAYDGVLERDPRNPEALTYRGWLLVQAGLLDEGLADITAAVEVDPTYPDARVFRGLVWRQQGRLDDAAAELQAALDTGELPADFAALVADTLAGLEAGGSATPPGSGG